MGQRLNIEIVSDGEVFANAYYHWSAYTGSAIGLTQIVLDAYNDYMDEHFSQNNPFDNQDMAIRILEATGAGANQTELARIAMSRGLCKYKVQDCADRNRGLLSITPEGIEETEQWEEGRVTINVESEVVEFSVYYDEPYIEWEADRCTCEEEKQELLEEYEALHEIDFDPCCLPFDRFHELWDVYERTRDTWGYRMPNGNVVSWIE